MVPSRRRKLVYLILMSVPLLYVTPVLAEANGFQPYSIPDDNPSDYDDIKKVVIEGEGNGPMENIHKNLQKAFSGGWEWELEVNGVFDQEEPVCPPSEDEPIGARCEDENFTFWRKIGPNEWKEEIICPTVSNEPEGSLCRARDRGFWERTGPDEWTERLLCETVAGKNIGDRCEDNAGDFWIKSGNNEWTLEGTFTTQTDAEMQANIRVPRTRTQAEMEAEAQVAGTKTNAEMDSDAKKTDPEKGLISKVKGVPGRDTERAYGNIRSGLGMRRESGGTAQDISFNGQRRVENGQFSGFDYPTDEETVCGFTTVCRPKDHPDQRQVAPNPTDDPRGNPDFFCKHPCQRPLDGDPPIGKPKGWDPADSSKVACGDQQPYEPAEDKVKYACGGLEMKEPGEDFCTELKDNGPLGGLCQDLNSWTYILWSKVVHVCYVITEEEVPLPDPPGGEVTIKVCNPVPIRKFEKGPCGFPEELGELERNQALCRDEYEASTVNECCSDDGYGAAGVVPEISDPDDEGNTEITSCGIDVGFDEDRIGTSCKTCKGEACRLFPDTNNVIVPDQWFEPFPTDLDGQCLVASDDCDVVLSSGYEGKVNHGPWPIPPEDEYRLVEEDLEYISYFREYNDASYERSDAMTRLVSDDDFKKEHIPVACYGMYDVAPEDAKIEQTESDDKRCTIAVYYEQDDGDGDEINFWSMKSTQRGKGIFKDFLDDNPFNDRARTFNEDVDLWWPQLKGNSSSMTLGAFSMINDGVFSNVFHGDFSFTLLTTDSAKQRATVQLDLLRKLSSGALIRTPDDTITIEKDLTKERRTVVQWWHIVETEMHKNFTPPTVRLLLPTTWTIDLNPLDPLYTPPEEPQPGDLSPDIRSESIEIQVQAREDLLGDVVSFMERALLLRIEGAPVPVVVPIVNPTELRAIAQGWETWARKQEEQSLPGVAKAREVAEKLKEYADQADDVRKLRAQLPRYAGAMLIEQKRITQKLADWLDENIQNYRTYLLIAANNQFLQLTWQRIQQTYRGLHDDKAFPWPRNARFTSPIYSLLDPWLPGRENAGDTTGGATDRTGLADYTDCLQFVMRSNEQFGEEVFPDIAVCDRFYPVAPRMPQPPDAKRDPDMVLDFTAFREPQRAIMLPILKPIQIRIDFDEISPPPLERDEEPTYPILAPLPAFPDELSERIRAALPIVINPAGMPELESFQEAAAFSLRVNTEPGDPFPKIKMPTLDILRLGTFLSETKQLIEDMDKEYTLFWESLTLKRCEGGNQQDNDCVKPGTEQDCIEPHDDPKKKCVHFEADLKERFQRIGSRPAIFLFDDLRSIGKFRKPIIHGQTYCEREDWACQLYNFYARKPREGWMLDITKDFNPETMIREIRTDVREESSNIIQNADERFLYDMPQQEMFENFRVPEGEHIERYIERFEPKPLEEGEACTDNFCEIIPPEQ